MTDWSVPKNRQRVLLVLRLKISNTNTPMLLATILTVSKFLTTQSYHILNRKYLPFQTLLDAKILQDNYESIIDTLPFALPIIECGGYKCKQGSFSCLSLRKFQFENFHSNETLQLLCKDADGTF